MALTRSTARRNGKADQVARAAAAALQAPAPRRRVRVVRTPSPPPAFSPSPSPGPGDRNLRTTPGSVYVVAYEGADMMKLSKFAKGRFLDLCFTPRYGQGITPNYVSSHFRVIGGSVKKGHKSGSSVFTLVAIKSLQDRDIIVGYAQCTLYTALKGVQTQKVVKLDLICTQGRNPSDRLKGAANILMNELERYAAGYLGANVLVLDSVDNPNTWDFYLKQGFTRSSDQCTHTPQRNAQAQRNYAIASVQQKFELEQFKNYKAATQQRYYPDLNTYYYGPDGRIIPDTVFMSKCVRGQKANRLGVRYTPGSAPTSYAHFPGPATRVLAVYGSGVPLPRLNATGATAPDLFRPRVPQTLNGPRRSPRVSTPPRIGTPPARNTRKRRSLTPNVAGNKKRRQ